MKAVLYIGHGTRSKTGAQEIRTFIERVMKRIDVPIQLLCFLELTDPSIEEGFRQCIDKGATEIVMVPLFLLAAGHIKEDIPAVLSALKEQYPQIGIKVRDPFGIHGGILDGVAELIRKTAGDLLKKDSVLIVGRGSSDPGLHADFSKISAGIRGLLGTEHVEVCYLAAAEPRFEEGLEFIAQKTAGRVIVVPYLIFSGLLIEEIDRKVREREDQGERILHTGPLSRHRVIEDIVVQRAAD